MIGDPDRLFERHRPNGLLLDANLLLLYVAGSQDRKLIGKGKLSQYTAEDFELVRNVIGAFARLVTTLHILTEVSNLLGDFGEGAQRRACFEAFAATIADMREEHAASRDAAGRKEFSFLGLTDCVIAEFADRFFVLSNDARMVVKLHEAGLDAVNFNHFRRHLQELV